MTLLEFLVEARRETYAIPTGTALGDGTEEMAWRAGDWRYQDRYAGTNPYGGHELIWHREQVVWLMHYFAEVVSTRCPMDAIYAFQREALGRPDPARPMRGPAAFARPPFAYVNDIEGDLERFSGVETIASEGEIVYRMVFHGGCVGG